MLAGQKPPGEELARAGSETVEPAPADLDRGHGGTLRQHPHDAQAVPEGAHRRHPEPAGEQARRRHHVQAGPVQAGARGAHEVAAGGELVAVGEGDGHIGVEVREVPRLIAQPAAQTTRRGCGHRDEQREPGHRGDDARVSVHQSSDLGREPEAVAERVAHRREQCVRAQQPQARHRRGPVPRHAPVKAGHSLQHREPGEKHELHEGDVGTEQPGHPPGADQRRREIAHVPGAGGQPERGRAGRAGAR